MFQEGDYIVYRSTGVCRVEQVAVPEDFDAAPDTLYYCLAPVRGSGVIYVPVNSPVFMRPILTREEAMALISAIPQIPEQPNYSRDQKALQEQYKTQLRSHDCRTLVQMIKGIRKKSRVLTATGKSAGKTDLQYMKQAEAMLHEELSVALGIPYEQLGDFVLEQLQQAVVP